MSSIEYLAADAGAATRHIYPSTAMVGDYLRAAAGLVPACALLATIPLGTAGMIVVGGFAAIFAAFGARTVLRHGTGLEMTDAELYARGLRRRTLVWAELDHMRLAYYSTRRDRKDGWMQLELATRSAKVRLDSRIAGFDQLVRRAAEAAAQNGLALNQATVANLRALGIRLPEESGAA